MSKRALRKDKEFAILIGLIEHYIKTGKPVGSQALQEAGFSNVSSATIRNYFAALEEQGYVTQLHTSGGRVPLSKGFQLYAGMALESTLSEPVVQKPLALKSQEEWRDVVSILQEAAAHVSAKLKVGVVVSAPRFDRDAISDIHFHFLDVRRVLAVVLSEFGLVHTEVLMPLESVSPALVRKADRFAKMRLYKEKFVEELYEPGELDLIRKLYQEAVSSFFVRYSSFSEEDVWKMGFSHLLDYPEFQEASALGASLSLFENNMMLRGLFREVVRQGKMRYWLGESLQPLVSSIPNCAFIAAPYRVGNACVGALGLLGPERLEYKETFRLIRGVVEQISEILTTALVKQRITYRMPERTPVVGDDMGRLSLEFCSPKLLESK